MINSRLNFLCKELRLDTLADTVKQQIKSGAYEETRFEDRLLELLENQCATNLSKKVRRMQKQAHLRYPDVYIEDMEYDLYPSLNMRQFKQLAKCDWVRNKKHLIVIGSTGLGKTNIACILAQLAIAQELPVLFYRLTNLLLELIAAQKEGELIKFIKKLNRAQLLIIDDWGNALMEKNERHLLFELIESRDKVGSLLITSQYPVDVWHNAFQDATVADSVLNRIVHNGHKIELKGDSIRKLLSVRENGNA